jgi:hypothetical protein
MIILLQVIETATGSIAAYGVNVLGWSQPDPITLLRPDTLVYITTNVPPTIDALSKLRITLYRHVFILYLIAGFFVQLFFTWRMFSLSKIFFGIKTKVAMFGICILTLLVSFSF